MLGGAEKGLVAWLRGVGGTDDSGDWKGSTRESSISAAVALRSMKRELGGWSRFVPWSGEEEVEMEDVDEMTEGAAVGGRDMVKEGRR